MTNTIEQTDDKKADLEFNRLAVYRAINEKKYSKAIPELERFQKINPSYMWDPYFEVKKDNGEYATVGYDLLGFCYEQIGEFQKAKESNLLQATFCARIGAYISAAKLYEKQGYIRKAIEQWKQGGSMPGYSGWTQTFAAENVSRLEKILGERT